MSLEKWLTAVVGTVILVFLVSTGAYCQGPGAGEAAYHNQQGLEYFRKGYYEHAPKHRAAEMEKSYELAVREFEAAISRDFSYADAHRNLARVLFLQKNFNGAADEYKKVVELAPSDLDAYVNLALAFIELKRPEEAVQALEDAKTQTFDPKALETLDSYIAKVRTHHTKEMK